MAVDRELTVRALTAVDAEMSRTLGFEAFGTPKAPPTEPASIDSPGRTFLGSFAGDRLAARLAIREYESWFGGARVPTAGIASVTVAMEDRGRGALTPLVRAGLERAREAGAVISTLFPSAPGIYRRFGYELVSDYRTVQVTSASLAKVAAPSTAITLRRATTADFGAIDVVYSTWAAAQNGPLTRHGVSFPTSPAGYLEDFDGVSVAVDPDGSVVGFASWDRGQGYGPEATLEVSDLLALSADGYRALLQGLGTFATITGHTKIDTSGDDLVQLLLPTSGWQTTGSDPYMLAVLDVPGAITARRYAAALDLECRFGVEGHFVPEVNGGYAVRVNGGEAECEAECEATEPGDAPVFTARGLALLYAGVQSCANLRFAGLLRGSTQDDDAAFDALFGGRQFHIRDYF